MDEYNVSIVRTDHASETFTVMAKDEDEAKEKALQKAYDTVWGSGNVEYEVEDIQGPGFCTTCRRQGKCKSRPSFAKFIACSLYSDVNKPILCADCLHRPTCIANCGEDHLLHTACCMHLVQADVDAGLQVQCLNCKKIRPIVLGETCECGEATWTRLDREG